ncbi:hypothetical protein ACFTAO_45810 [Paenibacillus rhizoplanae]
MTAIIQTEGLTKHFGSHHAVDQLSIEVNPGEIYGFLGAERSRQKQQPSACSWA